MIVKTDTNAWLVDILTSPLLPSWSVSCASTGQCRPRTRYLLLHCVPGLGLLAASLATQLLPSNNHGRYLPATWSVDISNYLFIAAAFTHVGEHVARGLAILLLLPKDRHRRGDTPTMLSIYKQYLQCTDDIY